jgi:8-oxo-dGTP diphosphatase
MEGEKEFLQNYNIEKYDRPSVTTDVAMLTVRARQTDNYRTDERHSLSILLVRRGRHPYKGMWALPGGFLNIDVEKPEKSDKTIAHTAARELKEETGLVVKPRDFREIGCYSDKNRDPRERVISIAHYVLVKLADVQPDTDAEKAEWYSMKDVPSLAFDHDKILRVACFRLRQDIHFEPVGFELMPEIFTLPQLQNLYESILEVKFDRRNFANKMKHFGLLTEVEDGTPRHGTRTPIKYRFDKDNYERLKAKGFQLEF